jgi:hypothetical protein
MELERQHDILIICHQVRVLVSIVPSMLSRSLVLCVLCERVN